MATGSVPITAGTGTPIRIVSNAGVDAGADQQVFTLADQYGVIAPSDPDGTFQVDTGATTLAFETFDGTLTSQWATGGTAPTQASGALTFNAGTTASVTSYITSNNPLQLQANAYMEIGWVVQLDAAAALTNNTRWFGFGQNATTPTAAAPITNGVVFMLDYAAGAFYAATYSAGTRTQTVVLTKPTDAAFHRYQIYFRTSRAYFQIDGVTVATISYPNTAVSNNLFLIAGSANFTTAPATATTMVASVASAADGGENNGTISDAAYPSVRATVKKASTAAATADTALVTAMHPSSPMPLATLTKGTQGTTGITTQDLKDAGRVPIILSATAVVSATTETLFTLNIWKGGAVLTAASQYQVTTGKTLRIQQIQFGSRFTTPSSTVTFASARFNMRALTATGTLAIGSPLIYGDTKLSASNSPTPNSDLTIPDGLELPGGYVIGFSHIDSAATLSLDLVLVGYEY